MLTLVDRRSILTRERQPGQTRDGEIRIRKFTFPGWTRNPEERQRTREMIEALEAELRRIDLEEKGKKENKNGNK
jgi:hypothetical protein